MCFAGAEKMKGSRDVSGFLEVEKSRKSAGGGYEMRPGTRVACRVAVAALFLALLVTATTFAAQAFQPRVRPCLRCPFDWIGYRGKCYSFSEAEANWTSSRDNCSALGASLAMFDSTEDLVRTELALGFVGVLRAQGSWGGVQSARNKAADLFAILRFLPLLLLGGPGWRRWGRTVAVEGWLTRGSSNFSPEMTRSEEPGPRFRAEAEMLLLRNGPGGSSAEGARATADAQILRWRAVFCRERLGGDSLKPGDGSESLSLSSFFRAS
ncbi:uncharacterized protein [Struthio camelus]|uniref:uncharacterized protein isoform X1 n=1 Tax=Struthio camelus TaxID=8801 RepID=UPI003603CD24